jgi:phosphatidylinositol alpha-mannosyltransferase
MAAGLPIVASDIPGYRDVARDGREAVLVTPGDPAALVAGVARVLDDPALARSLGDNGKERARIYDWDTVTQKIVDLYREALR